MNLGNLRTMARAQVPGAKKTRINNTTLDIILNNGKDDVATKSICLKANQKFAIAAISSGISEYNLSDIVNRFLVIDKAGLLYRSSITADYDRLDPKTIEWLDQNRPHWRDEDPGTPRYYYQNGNILGLVPAASDSVAQGGWLYFGQRPPDMTEGEHYPFGGASEISRLVPLQQAILAYARWQLRFILNKGLDEYRMGERAYKDEVAIRIAEIKRRPDISAHEGTKFGGDLVV